MILIFAIILCLGLPTIAVSQPAPMDSLMIEKAQADSIAKKDAAGRQIIRLEEGEVEGRLSRPQVVFLLQHNEHAFRTFNIRKDVSEELKRYVPKQEMIKRYRIFYEDRLKERLW